MDEAPRDTENDSRAPDGESSTVDQAGVDTFAAPDDPSTNIELTHAKTIEPDADFLAAQTAEDSNAPQSPDQTSAPAGGAETPEPEAHAESSETGNSIGAGADTTDEIIPPDDAESEPWSSPEAVADTVQADTFATDAKITEANNRTPTEVLDNTPASTAQSTKPQKKSWWNKKHTIITVVVAVVVVALVGGSAAAYSLWYEAPSKVLADAAVNLVSAKSMTYTGSLSTKSSGTALSVTMNGASSGQVASLNLDATISSGSTKFNVPISLVGNAQEFYFKLSNLTALESQFINPYLSMPGGASIADQAKIDVFMKQIDGTWYSVTQSDLGSTSHNEQTGQCVQNVINSVRTNKSTQNEIMNVYRTHPLFTISKSLGSQNGSLGYVVKPASSANTKAFFQALETTSAYKALTKCDSSYASFLSAQDSTTSPTQDVPSITVWVSRWSHQLTKITMSDTTGGNDVAMTFEPKVGAQADVTIPKNAKSIKDLQSQIESLFESLGAGDMTGFSVDANGYTEVTPQNQAQIEAQAQAEFQQKQAEAKALQTSN